MKTIVAGSREITNFKVVEKILNELPFKITEVVCGGAQGVDSLGRKWAANGNLIPVKLFLANWNRYGKSAGYRRNAEMADYAEALVAIWDGESKGTDHMIDTAIKKGLYVLIYSAEGNFIGMHP